MKELKVVNYICFRICNENGVLRTSYITMMNDTGCSRYELEQILPKWFIVKKEQKQGGFTSIRPKRYSKIADVLDLHLAYGEPWKDVETLDNLEPIALK